MKLLSTLQLGMHVLWIMLLHKKTPMIGSIIITDRCNLSCLHCAVNNKTGILYPYSHIQSEMASLYEQGVRILIFYGGEPCLWKDAGRDVGDLVKDAKRMGFYYVNVISNGTFPLDIPEADLILVSLDGGPMNHNRLRGPTYDVILRHISNASADNICLYMAINKLNLEAIEDVCQLAVSLDQVRAISFNFHTPYPGTENLTLSLEDKQDCCDRIEKLMDEGYPIMNLRSAFPYIVHNNYETPCYWCVVVENGRQWVCGRCLDIEGLCQECGFFFPAEYALLFSGNMKAIREMVFRYLKYL